MGLCACMSFAFLFSVSVLVPSEKPGAAKDGKGASAEPELPRWVGALLRNWGDDKTAVRGAVLLA